MENIHAKFFENIPTRNNGKKWTYIHAYRHTAFGNAAYSAYL
jgi:hypothetical protein